MEKKIITGSCDLPSIDAFANYRRPELEQEVPRASDVSVIPAEKLARMKEYAALLHKKHPQMKPNRIKRKVAEHFKVKLV